MAAKTGRGTRAPTKAPPRKKRAAKRPPSPPARPAPASFVAFVDSWNALQGQSTPPLHARIASWLETKRIAQRHGLVLLAFRSSGKSTLVGLYCAWLFAGDPNLRVLVLAATHALARKMVRNVKRIVERHPACAGLKPVKTEQWAADQFIVAREAELRDPSMVAKDMTGSRADVVICDDVEVPNNCDTASKREDLRERLHEIEYVLVPGGLQLYIGTPHAHESIYAEAAPEDQAPFLEGFERLAIPLLDEKGDSAWPERFSPERIAAIRKRTGPRKFQAQMMLEPLPESGGRLDLDRMVPYDGALDYSEANRRPVLTLEGKQLVSASCWWDPSYGKPTGDRSVIAVVFVDESGLYWLHEIAYLKAPQKASKSDDEAAQYCRQVAEFAKRNHVQRISVEANGVGAFLPGILRRELAQAEIACAVVAVHTRRAKEARILEAFDARLAARSLNAHREIWSSPFAIEMREWRPGGGSADDGLDAVAGCLLSEPVRFGPPGPGAKRKDWRPGADAHAAKTEFEP
jgi:hypothetical protein